MELPGQPGFVTEILKDFSCIFCFKIIHFLEKEVYSQPAAPSCPAMLRHGAEVYFRALSSLSFCLKKKNTQKTKLPPPSSCTHKLFRVKPFWNPGTKAISSINHLLPTPLCPLHPSSERKLTMENSVILWLNQGRRVPPPWLPGDTTRNPTILGCVNVCDNLRQLGRYYTSPSNTLASRPSHVLICFYFWLG